MNDLFGNALDEINEIKLRAHRSYVALSFARAAAMASVVTALWLIVEPTKPLIAFGLGGITLVVLASFTSLRKKHQVGDQDFLLSLDMNFPASKTSPFIAWSDDVFAIQEDWQPKLQREIKRIRALETRRLSAMISSISIPILVSVLLWFKSPPSLSYVADEVQSMFAIFSGGTTLEVLAGAVNEKEMGKPITLGGDSKSIKLLPQNMLRVKVASRQAPISGPVPSVELRSLEGDKKTLQSFQMSPEFGNDGRQIGWTIDFSATEKTALVIPAISDEPLALPDVQVLPIPEVELTVATPIQDPWPDNVPVPFNIHVKAHNPLHKIQIVVRGKTRSVVENVTTVVGDSTKEVTTDYKLNLEPYMEEDFLEFEVTAQAIDHAQPQPLTGTSAPILIRAASAYGRYRNTLATLMKIKAIMDASLGEAKGNLDPQAFELADTAQQQSESSPFFDTIDRMELAQISSGIAKVKDLSGKALVPHLIEVSANLGEFLFEHEALDDRERDRDFFIAIRTFSRILEKKSDARPVPLPLIAEKLTRFLDQRHARWIKRVEHLGDTSKPHQWPKIRDSKPFHAGVREALQSDERGEPIPAQAILARVTNQYKSWIDELEAKEDEARQRKEQERQQGLADARNELREIQQRQDQVSSALDRASERSKEDLASQWPSARMQELANTKQAAGLLQQLRALSPSAGERLEAAISTMEIALNEAGKSEFINAESASDMAGRLLREAEQSAARSQQRRDRGRRKRASGDDYHGNSVVGGDIEIKSEYSVDPRYREEILRDIQSSGNDAEDRTLLDNYLRQVLR